MARSARNSRPISRFFQSGALPALFFLALVLSLVPGLATAAGTWIFNMGLSYRFYCHTATLLPTGKVLVAGGYSKNVDSIYTSYLNSAVLFDPGNGTWTATGTMAAARACQTATLLPNGKVLEAGGYTEDQVLNSAELYDPTTGAWSATGAMVETRTLHTATLLPNGKVLVTGGFNNISLNSAELYDPATGSWTPTGSMTTARYNHTATLLPNGLVLVAGGCDSWVHPINSAELYNPATGAWTATGVISSLRWYHTATLLPNGQVLVAGGGNASAELYDPATRTWTLTGSMSSSRVLGHTATLLPNGQVLVAGGFDGHQNLASAELYDPATGTWTATGAMNIDRDRHTATLLPNGQVLAAGASDQYWTPSDLYDSPPGVFHTITASVTGKGSILPSEGGPVGEGMAFTFFFVRAPNYHLASVAVDGTPLPGHPPASYTFSNVTADHTLSVTFQPNLGGFTDIVTDKTLVRVIKGGTGTFRVKLSGNPLLPIQVSVTKENGGNEEITAAGGANLSFDSSNWDAYQTVTLAATGNPGGLNGIATFRLSAAGLTPVYVAAKKVNPDQAAINLLLSGN